MNINKISFLLLTSVITLILQSCDPGVKHNKIIQNDSDFDLKFYIYPGNDPRASMYNIDSIVISSHSELPIYEYRSIGQTTEFENCNTFTDSISAKVVDNDSLELFLNLNDQTNWNFSVLDQTFKKGGTCECRVIITNNMID